MPAVPLVLAVTGASAAVGAAAATAIGLGTVSAIAATAIGTGIVAGGMAAVQGGDVSDVLESAVKGGVTSFVGGTVAGAVGGAVSEATGSTILGGAAGGAAGTLATGGSPEDILKSGLIGGTISGLRSAEDIFNQNQFEQSMTESGLAGQTLTDDVDQLLIDIQPGASLDIPGTASKLDLFGAARNLTPAVVTALLQKSAYENVTQDESGQNQYAIVAPPTDWKPPEYNQTFTPSAPIDFGTPALLAGTQWETPQQTQAPQPYTLTNLINTLNYQPVPFVPQQYDMPQQVSTADFVNQFQQPTVGTTEIIGELGGSPVSIADIILGIQSQYGQKTSS